MNHIGQLQSRSSRAARSVCPPERSLATSEASRQTESKDPYHRDPAPGNFRIAIRFLDVHEDECVPACSREVGAKEPPAGQNRK